MNRCKLCQTPVLNRKKRRSLQSLLSASVKQAIVDLACSLGPDYEDAHKRFSEGYICIRCYRDICSCMRLKEIEKELKRLLSLSYGNVTQSKPIPGTKRRHAPLDSAAKTVKVITVILCYSE